MLQLLPLFLLALITLPLAFYGVRRVFGRGPMLLALVAGLLLVPISALAQEAPVSSPVVAALSEGFVQYVLPILLTGVAALLTAALAAATSWFRAKAGEANANKIAVAGAHFAATTADTLKAIVLYVETRIRPELAKASEDGRLTPEEIIHIRRVAFGMAKQALGDEAPGRAEELLGIARPLFGEWLEALLESAVKQLPKSVARPEYPRPGSVRNVATYATPSPL